MICRRSMNPSTWSVIGTWLSDTTVLNGLGMAWDITVRWITAYTDHHKGSTLYYSVGLYSIYTTTTQGSAGSLWKTGICGNTNEGGIADMSFTTNGTLAVVCNVTATLPYVIYAISPLTGFLSVYTISSAVVPSGQNIYTGSFPVCLGCNPSVGVSIILFFLFKFSARYFLASAKKISRRKLEHKKQYKIA